MDPLDEILAACGIPDESKYRTVVQRDGHNVVTERHGTLTIGGVTLPITSFQMHHSVDATPEEQEYVNRVSDWLLKKWVDHGDE